MPTEVETLLVRLEADTERLRREMRKAEDGVEKNTKKIAKSLKRVDNGFDQLALAVKRFAGPAALGLLGQQAASFVRDQAKMASALADTATKLGTSTKTLQEFRVAAEQVSGVTQQTADMALQRFIRRLGEAAQGGGELKGTLDRLGIATKDSVSGQTRAAVDVMADLADRMAGATSQSERLAIAFKAFDSEGAALVSLLQQGGDALRSFMERATELGVVLDERAIKELQKTNKDLQLMQRIIDINLTQALRDIGPFLVRFSSGLSKVAGWAHDAYVWLRAIGDETVKSKINDVADEIAKLEKQLSSRQRAAQQGRGGGLLSGAIAQDEENLARLQKELLRLRQQLESEPNLSRPMTIAPGPSALENDERVRQSEAIEKYIQRRLDELNERAMKDRADAKTEAEEKAAEEALKVAEETAKKQQEIARKNAEKIERIVNHSTDRIVDFGADAFDRIFQNGSTSFRDLGQEMLSIMRRTFAQIAAEAIIRPIVQPVVQGFVGGAANAVGGGVVKGFLGDSVGGGLSSALRSGGSSVARLLGFGSAAANVTTVSAGAAQAAALGFGSAAVPGVAGASAGLFGGGGILGLGAAGGPIALAALAGAGLLAGSSIFGGGGKTPRAGQRLRLQNGRIVLGASGQTGGGNIGINQTEAQQAADILNRISSVTGKNLHVSGAMPLEFTTRSENGAITRGAGDIVRDALRAGVVQGLSQGDIDKVLREGVGALEESMREVAEQAANAAAEMEALQGSLKSTTDALEGNKNRLRSFYESLINPLLGFGQQAAFGDLSADSPGGRLSSARGQFAATLGRARGGDVAAIQDLPGIGEAVIGLGREVFASGPDFVSLQRATTASIAAIQSQLEGQRNSALAEFAIPLVATVDNQTKALISEMRKQTNLLAEIENRLQQLAA